MACGIAGRRARSSWCASTGAIPPTSSGASRDGVVPNVARFMKNGFSAVADGERPELHVPEQYVDHHGQRRQSVHGISGNFYLDPRHGRGRGDDRARAAPLAHDDGGVLPARRARWCRSPPRTSCAAQLGKEMDLSRGSVNALVGAGRPSAPWRRPGIEDAARVRRPAPARHVLGRAVAVRAGGGGQAPRGAPAAESVSVADRLRPAQVRAGRGRGRPLLPRHGRPVRRASMRSARDPGAHRRPRHERQVATPTDRPR